MAGGRLFWSSAILLNFLILNIYLYHQKSDIVNIKVCSIHIYSGMDKITFPGRNSGLPRRFIENVSVVVNLPYWLETFAHNLVPTL